MKRIKKYVLSIVLAVCALLLCAFAGLYWTDPMLMRRLATFPFIDEVKDVQWYRPLAGINAGNVETIARAATEERTVPIEAWAKAVDYARQTNTYALIVWRAGRIEYEYYANDFNGDTLSSTASMHKTVLALVVGQVIASGAITSVDQSVADFISEWGHDNRSNIRIRDLLTMSSGLRQQQTSINPFGEFMQLTIGSDIEKLALDVPAVMVPGQQFSYYNVNPQVLQIVLERATGKNYPELLSDVLWSKLAATKAFVYLDRPNGASRTYCCLIATPEDWLRIGILLLDRGRVKDSQIVPSEWIAQMIQPSATNPNYGYLTWLGTTYEPKRSYGPNVPVRTPHSAPFVSNDIIYIDGAGGQRVYIIPSADMVIVRIGHGGIDFEKREFRWDDSYLPNILSTVEASQLETEASD